MQNKTGIVLSVSRAVQKYVLVSHSKCDLLEKKWPVAPSTTVNG